MTTSTASTAGAPLVKVEALTKVFGEGHTAVRAVESVSLEIGAGEVMLIMGPSGSGKTTLLSMIGGLMRPTAGRVFIANQEITALSERQLTHVRQRLVGFIFQSFNLLEALSAEENVELVMDIAGVKTGDARRRSLEALSGFGLASRVHARPRTLSGGEKQRVSIARALANQPLVVLADEPTANLDSKHGRDVMLLLKQEASERGTAVIVVSHDDRIREVADRVLWLEDGRLREVGRLQRDPVCGMAVDEEHAVLLHDGGMRHFFCSNGCRDEFLSSPDRFTPGQARTT